LEGSKNDSTNIALGRVKGAFSPNIFALYLGNMNKPRNFAHLSLPSCIKQPSKLSNIGKLSKPSKLRLLDDRSNYLGSAPFRFGFCL